MDCRVHFQCFRRCDLFEMILKIFHPRMRNLSEIFYSSFSHHYTGICLLPSSIGACILKWIFNFITVTSLVQVKLHLISEIINVFEVFEAQNIHIFTFESDIIGAYCGFIQKRSCDGDALLLIRSCSILSGAPWLRITSPFAQKTQTNTFQFK